MLDTIRHQFARTAARTGLDRPGVGVLEAMARISRERFVPAESAERAYDDTALSLPCGQTISQPFVVALMTSLLRPAPQHRVLKIGTGSGYQAAVLGELVGEVHTVELLPELANSARERLRGLGYGHVHVHTGDGGIGWPEQAPYDGILVACGSESMPDALVDQLAPGGHLVIPIGPRDDQRLLDVHRAGDGRVHTREVLDVRFVPFVRTDRAPRSEHFADPRGVGVRAIAGDRGRAFATLALEVSALVADPAEVRGERRVEFACSAPNAQQLLQRWLDEVVHVIRRERLVFAGFEVRLVGDSLRAVGFAEPLDVARHTPRAEPRAMTVLAPAMEAHADGWCARCCVALAPRRERS